MTEPDLLACGRDPLDVADHAAAGTLDEHELTCEYCQAVVTAAVLSARLGAQAATEENAVEPPRDLVPRVMRTVRAELRTTRQIPLATSEGAAFVTDHVVTTVLRDALDAASGLVVASCRVELLSGSGLGVRIAAYGRYGQDLAAAAAATRALVVATLDRQFGLVAEDGVDVAVVDLIGAPA